VPPLGLGENVVAVNAVSPWIIPQKFPLLAGSKESLTVPSH
jgi:hypothetical protein